VTFRYDTASFTAADQLEKCLQLGFDEVVELGRPRRARRSAPRGAPRKASGAPRKTSATPRKASGAPRRAADRRTS
jgi:hypothetical protein